MRTIRAVLSLALIAVLIGLTTPASFMRYANTQPAFGEADTTASARRNGITQSVGFTDVAPSTVSSYAAVNSGQWSFDSTFTRKTSATGSGRVDDEKYYTVFTKQTAPGVLRNELLEDGPTNILPPDTTGSTTTGGGYEIGNNASVRAVNLAAFSFPANVLYSGSSSASTPLFTNVAYGASSAWTPLSPGLYNFEWEAANQKRSLEQNWSVIVVRERRYTIWLLPTGPIVTQDAIQNKRRSVSQIRQKRVAQRDSVLNEKAENVEEAN